MLERLELVLKEHFTNSFRGGYVTIKGVTMPQRFQEMYEDIKKLKVREEDVWVCSFPKTGTTWTQEMAWMILNNMDFEGGKTNLGVRSPFLEVSALFDYRKHQKEDRDFVPPPFIEDSLGFVQQKTDPTVIKTHLPFHLLPEQITTGTKKPKIIYVSRNPKDTCISYYHHARLLEGYTGTFQDFAQLFLNGKLCFAPFWQHVLPFWNQRHQKNILFVKYEDMKEDLGKIIRQVSDFLGGKLSEKQLDNLEDHLSFESMKQNPSVNYELILEFNRKHKLIEQEGSFMRSGKVGGFKQLMNEDLIKQFDEWTKKSLQDSDFTV